MRYQVRGTGVVHELLDNEIIIANLDTGIYYSLRESGVPIWLSLISGYDFNEIVSSCLQNYSLDITEELQMFVHQLTEEGLLIKNEKASISEPPSFLWPLNWSPLHLEKYEEMKNLLLLDPIHEVDEQGWPNKR